LPGKRKPGPARRRRLAVLFAAPLALLLVPITVGATASTPDEYTTAARHLLTLVQFAGRGDEPSRRQALISAEADFGNSQPEILADLRKEPPELADAESRLRALLEVLAVRPDTPDPERARQELNRILAMPRYEGMRAGPSLLDQVLRWIGDRLAALLGRLGVGRVDWGTWGIVITAVAALLVIALLLRTALGRGGWVRRPPAATPSVAPAADHFAEADRRASTGDYAGALRALANGVATALGGERAWNRSPLTLRELFARAEQPQGLRPLLYGFESTFYGHHPPDANVYARAAEAASPYRK
jgi:hypothetical protein